MGCSPQYCIERVDRVIGPTSQSPRAPLWDLGPQFYSGGFPLGYHSRFYACMKPSYTRHSYTEILKKKNKKTLIMIYSLYVEIRTSR